MCFYYSMYILQENWLKRKTLFIQDQDFNILVSFRSYNGVPWMHLFTRRSQMEMNRVYDSISCLRENQEKILNY